MDLTMELKKGTTLQGGKYKIEKKLGQGSFGITYLATAKFSTDSGIGKMDVVAKVCIKEFFMSDVNSRKEDGSTIEGSFGTVFTNYQRKFRKEAENLAKLSHSNIVRVFDVFDENGTSYYVMEFIDGENLDDYIKSKGRLPEDDAIKIIKEVGSALSYMHSKKMLHLDMKPKNVMHRNDTTNHLIDFGLSKQYTENGEPESSTTIGLGTPGYAPLEQSQYKQDGSFPATLDVYALGATLFKMLTGKRPPEAPILLNEGFPSKDLESIGVSKGTIDATAKAMNPIRKQRWMSINMFLNNLSVSDNENTSIVTESNDSDVVASSETNFNQVNLLKRIWNSRNIITNLVCLLGLFCTLLEINIIAAHTNFSSEITLFLGMMSVLVGIVAIMYGIKKFLFAPVLILPFCGILQLYSPGGCNSYLQQAIIITVGYLVVIGSLYLKKDKVSAISIMGVKKQYMQLPPWNIFVKLTTYFMLAILLIAIPCVFSNFHIEYYRFGALELVEILFCTILIIMRLRIGGYLIPIILGMGYIRDLTTFSGGFYNIIVENCITILYIIEFMVLVFIKKNGIRAWTAMK